MIDHTEHIRSIVKDELARMCTIRGIDKKDAGFAIGGFGEQGLIFTSEGEATPTPRWSLTISLRRLLLGQDRPEAASVPVPGVVPPDDHFRAAVQFLLAKVDEKRQADFRGEPAGPTMSLSERPQ